MASVTHCDQYCTLILLYLFNPVVVSLRSLQQASELQKVQKLLGCKRASLGSLSEAVTVFDPDRLKGIIAELGTELVPLGRDPRLQDVPGLLTVVDGTLLSALPKMMEASLRKGKTGTGMVKWRLHTHFCAGSRLCDVLIVQPDRGCKEQLCLPYPGQQRVRWH